MAKIYPIRVVAFVKADKNQIHIQGNVTKIKDRLNKRDPQ
jgi:hypothetical protein